MLNTKAFALSAGIIWGLTIFLTTLLSVATGGYGKVILESYGNLHPGYSISIVGASIGLAYAFICAFVGIYVLVGLYNKLEKRLGK